MHAPSALLAGTVLTFAVAALANLYLPAAPAPPPVAVVAPIALEEQGGPSAEAIAFLNEPADSYVSDSSQVVLTEDPLPASQELVIGEPAVSAPEPAVEAAAPTIEAKAEPAPAAPVQRPKKSAQKASVVKRPAAEPAAASPKTAAPIPFTESEAPTVFAKPAEAPKASTTASPGAMSVSAISGERAWIRIGDSKTVAVQTGDQVPGVGHVKSVDAQSVTFDSGIVLRTAP